MDKTELYRILDIETPQDFTYYENMAALLEEDAVIEENLLRDLLRELDPDVWSSLLASYFDEFMSKIPDDEVDLYVIADTMQRALTGCSDPSELADAIARFRKWYVIESPVLDKRTGEELSIRDARYNILGAKYTGEKPEYDFRRAYRNDMSGYDVKVQDMIASGEAYVDDSESASEMEESCN